MKHTVKLLTLAATLVAVIGLAGCNPDVDTKSQDSQEQNTQQETWDDGVVTKEPTCTTEGEKTYTCTNGETRTETIPALGHDYGDWVVTKEATCTEDGEKKHTCKREGCEHEETVDIKAHHHEDYETSGYCEKCKTYKFENGSKIYVNVYTLENNKLLKIDYLRYSFEEKNVEIELNDLIHLKSAYKNYVVTYCSYYNESDLIASIEANLPYEPYKDVLSTSMYVVVELKIE